MAQIQVYLSLSDKGKFDKGLLLSLLVVVVCRSAACSSRAVGYNWAMMWSNQLFSTVVMSHCYKQANGLGRDVFSAT